MILFKYSIDGKNVIFKCNWEDHYYRHRIIVVRKELKKNENFLTTYITVCFLR